MLCVESGSTHWMPFSSLGYESLPHCLEEETDREGSTGHRVTGSGPLPFTGQGLIHSCANEAQIITWVQTGLHWGSCHVHIQYSHMAHKLQSTMEGIYDSGPVRLGCS